MHSNTVPNGPVDRWQSHLGQCSGFIRGPLPLKVHGRLVRVSGLVMEAIGLALPLGSTCTISQAGAPVTEAEVVGFSGNRLFLMPTTEVHGLTPGALVTPSEMTDVGPRYGKEAHPWRRAEDRTRHMPVGSSLLGRVVDGNGRPLDRLGPIRTDATRPLGSRPINPIEREPIRQSLDVGVRAINALLTIGRGQRMGLFAGSGVGKSVLLGMMARYTTADVTVVGLIGERGREVKEFVEDILGSEGLARSIVVAAPADAPPLLRLQGAAYATSLAEHFRDEGKQVLLIMDSLSRYAMAQREIALAIGEPPATKGYPPSVFAKLPQLVERAGNGAAHGGAITAFYTILTEGDDQQDPIAESARAILDGHIVLDRALADQGHYPAIDIEASISRVMHTLSTDSDLARARRFKQLYSRYQRSRDLITVGAYVAGTDPLLDEAITMKSRLDAFLQQDLHVRSSLADSKSALQALLPTVGPQGSGSK
jgi:flagellum-specific ATP synthase